MYKGVQMIVKFIFLIILFSSYALAVMNPYESLPANEKINAMVNYFVNEKLESLKPILPQKDILKDDDANLEPIKYEQYFNYIQRLKAVKESRVQEQKKIDEKYQGQIAFYNGKLKNLKKFYQDAKNLDPIVQKSINKAFKVIYGKPKFNSVKYEERSDSFLAKIGVVDMYHLDTFVPKEVYFRVSKSDLDSFFINFQQSQINVLFDYSNNLLNYSSIIFKYNETTYKGIFTDENNDQIKLNIKINDDIFRLEKIE
jgi:hypothetical protein